MKKQILRSIMLGAFAVAAFLGCNNTTSVSPEKEDTGLNITPIKGQYIVVLKGDGKYKLRPGEVEEIEEIRSRVISRNQINETNILRKFNHSLPAMVVKLDEAELEKLRNDENVDYIEQDQMFTLAPPPGKGPGSGDGGSAAEEIPYGITRVNGGVSYSGSNVAWVLDTGIDLDHEDLNVDASRGFNAFTTGKDSKSLDDGNGHGTHVAGTIAAIDNEVGVVGVAAGATVIPVKVLDSRGSGSYSGVIAGIDYVGANGSAGDVANMSLGGGFSQAVNDAVVAASSGGIWFSLAAGNESTDANTKSPASANGNYIVTISAMDSNDNWASFSNYSNPPVDYCAPGVSIKSTWKNGGYNTISGTSMAAPHAAGVLLLGNARTDGFVNGDPDGNPDPIIVH